MYLSGIHDLELHEICESVTHCVCINSVTHEEDDYYRKLEIHPLKEFILISVDMQHKSFRGFLLEANSNLRR